jgi:hypothetical protein
MGTATDNETPLDRQEAQEAATSSMDNSMNMNNEDKACSDKVQ